MCTCTYYVQISRSQGKHKKNQTLSPHHLSLSLDSHLSREPTKPRPPPVTDRAGSAALDYILCVPARASLILNATAQLQILVGIWYIWWERRHHVHGEDVQAPVRSALSIAALTANYVKAMKKGSAMRMHGWSKPLEGFVKLNIDTAFRADSLRGTVGLFYVMIRVDSLLRRMRSSSMLRMQGLRKHMH